MNKTIATAIETVTHLTKQWVQQPILRTYNDDDDIEDYFPLAMRVLQETNATNSTTSTQSGNDGAVLRATFVVYGTFVFGMFITFCYVRRKFPHAYQLRNWVTDIKTPIAAEQFGFFSWMWQLNAITEDEIMLECGMDSVCILRLLMMGYKLCIVAVLNAIWLMPLYSTAASDSVINDPVISVTITKVANGSPRLIGTVLATYILFLYLMHLVLKEFEWFIEMRHKYLRRPAAENYTVYVRNIPPEYCSNEALYNYFAGCFSSDKVLEAKVRIKLPSLMNAVNKRSALMKKFEHAINYQIVKNKVPTHKEMQLLSLKRETVESIPHYAKALRDLNSDITNQIESIELITMMPTRRAEHFQDINDSNEMIDATTTTESDMRSTAENPTSTRFGTFATKDDISTVSLHSSKSRLSTRFAATATTYDRARVVTVGDDQMNDVGDVVDESVGLTSKDQSLRQGLMNTSTNLSAASRAAAGKTLSMAKTATSTASKIMSIRAEGEYYDAGFVTFSSLGTTQAAFQMVHHQTPFCVEVLEAPRPDDIFWSNVGRTHHDLQIGKLLSLGLTAALCLLWTIPIAFIASLSSIQALSNEIPPLGRLIEASPFIGKVFEVLAPLLVKVVNGLLPTILEYLTKFEGPVSSSIIVASLFTKLAAFMVIQTFFVSAVGSSLLKEIEAVVAKPDTFVGILAKSLPGQSTYFIQIVFVSTTITMGFEILRVMPLIFASIRRLLPPNLIEKERQTTVFGMFRPLADPSDFGHADSLAQITLNFIIMLVYATIAPLTVFIQGFCFLFMMICYKHQFVYIYPHNSDSGGKIWMNFVSVLMPCLLIAQFTIVGLLASKQSLIATPLLLPLIAITVLFNAYIHQQHFRVAEYLPSRESMKADLQNGPNFDLSFTSDAYLQEELREKTVYPENLSLEEARALCLFESVADR